MRETRGPQGPKGSGLGVGSPYTSPYGSHYGPLGTSQGAPLSLRTSETNLRRCGGATSR